MTEPRTLADLKVGDEVVAYYSAEKIRTYHVLTVANISNCIETASTPFLGAKRFRIASGNSTFGNWKLTLNTEHFALARKEDAERLARQQEVRVSNAKRETTELRQRLALARLEEYIAAWHGLNHELIAAVGGTQLLMSDLIEVVKMARVI